MESPPSQEKRKRRTKEELRAFYDQKLKDLAEQDKREVVRLLSGIHDDLVKVSTYAPAKGAAPELAAATNAVKAVLAKVGK